MADIAELGYKVDSREIESANRELDKNAQAAKRVSTATARMERDYVKAIKQARLLGIAVGALGLALLNSIVRNTIEAERVQAQLAAALKSTAGASGQTIASLNQHAGALQNVTNYGDEAINVAQGVLLTFTKIGGDTFPKATEAVLDMATALQMDLKSASIQVGKALNDPVLGVTALGRAGVQFSEDQKEMIRSLVETGDIAGAQVIILKELETQFGGSARAARDTLGGALQSLQNAFGDLLEGDSGSDGIRGTKDAIEGLTAVMQSEETKAAFQTVIQGLAQVATFAAETITMIAGVTEQVSQMTKANSDKSFQGLIDEQLRLEDDLQALEEGYGVVAALRARLDGNGISLFDTKEGNIDRVRAQLAEVIRLQDEIVKARNQSARGSAPEAGAGAATGSQTIAAKTQEMIDKLREEAEAYGLSKSALLEREKAKALAAASNDAERQALGESYDALIAVVRADEMAKGSKEGLARAARDAAQAQREAAQALADFTQTSEDLRAQLAGPVAQVQLEYERRERDLIALADLAGLSDQERAETLALLTQARERDLAVAQLQMKLEAEQLGPREQLFADLDRQIQLMRMGHIERETEIALEQMLLDLRRQGIELTPAQIEADRQRIQSKLEEAEALGKQIEAMDEFRRNFESNVADVLTGSKSAKDALIDMVDSFIAQLARLAAQQASTALFGAPGTAGGGSIGGFLGSILGAFGGGRAYGGNVRGDKFYEVGEGNRPELANIGGRQFLIPGNRGRVEPISEPMGRPTMARRGGDTFIIRGATSNRALERMRIDRDRAARRAQQELG